MHIIHWASEKGSLYYHGHESGGGWVVVRDKGQRFDLATAEKIADSLAKHRKGPIDVFEADVAVARAGGVKSWEEMAADKDSLGRRNRELRLENEQLRMRLLSAAGDDLCRLTQDEIKKYTSGEVQIPPLEEFLPSCQRFHEQIAAGPGVLNNCLTLAQLIAENAKLERKNAWAANAEEMNGVVLRQVELIRQHFNEEFKPLGNGMWRLENIGEACRVMVAAEKVCLDKDNAADPGRE